MRILSFSYCFPNRRDPTWGIFVQRRLAAVAARGELQVASPVPSFPLTGGWRRSPEPVSETWQGLTVHRPRFPCVPCVLKSRDGRFYARGLRRWLDDHCRQSKPDILDAHFVWPDGVGVSLLARRQGLPYAVTLRGKIYPCLDVPSQRKQCAEALRHAAVVISVDARMAAVARELGVAEERVHVIPNGVDLDHFRPCDKLDARRQLGLPESGRLLLTVAHLGPRKGHRETIAALARMPDDVRLVLVGKDGRRGRNAKALRELARSLGVENRVLVLGSQPHGRLPLYFSAADASVLASWREGCPNVVLESLASGTPVVASDVGGVSMAVEDGSNGRIVPPRQIEPLAAAIQEVLDRPPSPQAVRNSPAVRSWDMVAADVCAVLRRAVESTPASDNGSRRAGKPDGDSPTTTMRGLPPARRVTCR